MAYTRLVFEAQEKLDYFRSNIVGREELVHWVYNTIGLVLCDLLGVPDNPPPYSLNLYPPVQDDPARFSYVLQYPLDTITDVDTINRTFPGLTASTQQAGHLLTIDFSLEQFVAIKYYALNDARRAWQPGGDIYLAQPHFWRGKAVEAWAEKLLHTFRPDLTVATFKMLIDTGMFPDEPTFRAWLTETPTTAMPPPNDCSALGAGQ